METMEIDDSHSNPSTSKIRDEQQAHKTTCNLPWYKNHAFEVQINIAML